MSQAHNLAMTPEDFLAWEERQEFKWEFDGDQPVAMVGVTAAHSIIQTNILGNLFAQLRGRPCRPHGPEMMVTVGRGRYRYPDVLVTCTPLDPAARLVEDPVVIFEVLSDSTARTDRTDKLIEYRSMLSMRRYVMLEQDQMLATVIAREEHGWSIDVLRETGELAMPEIAASLTLAEIYDGLVFPARAE